MTETLRRTDDGEIPGAEQTEKRAAYLLPMQLAAAAALLAMMILTFVDVIGRYVFSRPISGSSELIQLLMGSMIAAALPLVTVARQHITMELFANLFRGTARHVLDGLILLSSAAVLLFLAWLMFAQGVSQYQSRATTIYLGLRKAPVAFGLCALMVIAALLELAAFRALIRAARARP